MSGFLRTVESFLLFAFKVVELIHENFDVCLSPGSCADICNLLKKGYISTKSHLTFDQEAAASGGPDAAAIPVPRNANSPASATEPMQEPMFVQSPVRGPDNEHHQRNASHDGNTEIDEEIEVLRHNGGHDGNDFLSDFLPSPSRPMPSPGKFVPSPGRDDFTPMPESNLGSERVPLLHAPDMSPSPGTYQGAQSTGLSDILELINTPGVEVSFCLFSFRFVFFCLSF